MSDGKSEKKAIRTGEAPQPAGSYSQGIAFGDMIFTAGQVGKNPATGAFPTTIGEQTDQTLRNIAAILREAGASMDDVVKTTVHLASFDDFDAFDAAYRKHFREPYPVRTTVESGLGGVLVEIDAMAIRKR
ncbi:Rid family detoxifying hydrolase [Synergistaceae bacterium OttesenSCG-928-I11]|nr:Rid family detoxifying hydrolase [Synergistaceae bacterium OttesenSCG-928-I11]